MTPFKGTNRVTSDYGPRKRPGGVGNEIHRGKDIVPTKYPGEAVSESAWRTRLCNTGQSGGLGVVDKVGYDSARGHYVDVLIRTAPCKVWERHQHMQSIAVQVGQKLAQGTVLGVAGSSGNVTGRHLHIGIYVGDKREPSAVEPSEWLGLPKGAGSYAGSDSMDTAQKPDVAPTVRVDKLRLRCGPGADYAVLELLTKGTQLDKAEVDRREGWTCRRIAGTDKVGWLSTDYIG